MKKTTAILLFFAAFFVSRAQAFAPVFFNYEGVALTNNGVAVDNSLLFLRISLVQNDETHKVLYQEIQKVRTNSIGLFHTYIGAGKPEAGSMACFAGGHNMRYIKVELVSIGETASTVYFQCVKCKRNDLI